MREVMLLKNGEIVLKGLNRPVFEDILIKNIRRRLADCGKILITKEQSTISIEPIDQSFDFETALQKMHKIFGIASFSRACVVEKNFETIKEIAVSYLEADLLDIKTFKVESKRSDKRFALTSPQISSEIGGCLLDAYPHLRVDLHNPDIIVKVEIRDNGAFIHAGAISGAGGMPVGSNGRAALLISGGIDSPVAGYMMSKRGVELCAVHFASPPYTSERAREKVMELLRIVSQYSGRISTYIVPFTQIQEQIRKNCPEEFFTIIMRRLMMNISNRIAAQQRCTALITGESLGQVASQTMEALSCTDAASELLVFRPLIGMDKEEIIKIARDIGTFETSILPFEDCCTVFTPKHPRTKPKIEYVQEAEAAFDFEPLILEAFSNTEKIIIC
jgi:thiamine biosynthesis protein ThiI